jgi:hypothetical protein
MVVPIKKKYAQGLLIVYFYCIYGMALAVCVAAFQTTVFLYARGNGAGRRATDRSGTTRLMLRKHAMSEKFSVGDMVIYSGTSSGKPIECKVVKVLPMEHAHAVRNYRVRDSAEVFDRAVPEFTLTLMPPCASDMAFKR